MTSTQPHAAALEATMQALDVYEPNRRAYYDALGHLHKLMDQPPSAAKLAAAQLLEQATARVMRDAVREYIETSGDSRAGLARALGITRQAVGQRYGDLFRARDARAAKAARMAELEALLLEP